MGRCAIGCHIFLALISGLFLIAGIALVIAGGFIPSWVTFDHHLSNAGDGVKWSTRIGLLEICNKTMAADSWDCRSMTIRKIWQSAEPWFLRVPVALLTASAASALVALVVGFLTVIFGVTRLLFDGCCLKCLSFGNALLWLFLTAAPVVLCAVAITQYMKLINPYVDHCLPFCDHGNESTLKNVEWGISSQLTIAGCAAYGVAFIFTIVSSFIMCCTGTGDRSIAGYDDFEKY